MPVCREVSWRGSRRDLKLTQAAAIGDPRVFLIVASEVAAGVAKRVLFCLPELSDAFPSDILVSLYRSLETNPRRSRGWSGPDTGWKEVVVDFDKITPS